MTALKTSLNDDSVTDFINSVANEKQRLDCLVLLELMQSITGEPPKMWGKSIVGFGSYHYKYESGREGDWFLSGFSPRKQNITIYIMSGLDEHQANLQNIGKHKTGKSCFYIKKLEDINMELLRKMIQSSIKIVKKRYA